MLAATDFLQIINQLLEEKAFHKQKLSGNRVQQRKCRARIPHRPDSLNLIGKRICSVLSVTSYNRESPWA